MPTAVEVSARPPLELRGPFVKGCAAPPLYYLCNVTTGIFAGDSYDVSLRCDQGAL